MMPSPTSASMRHPERSCRREDPHAPPIPGPGSCQRSGRDANLWFAVRSGTASSPACCLRAGCLTRRPRHTVRPLVSTRRLCANTYHALCGPEPEASCAGPEALPYAGPEPEASCAGPEVLPYTGDIAILDPTGWATSCSTWRPPPSPRGSPTRCPSNEPWPAERLAALQQRVGPRVHPIHRAPRSAGPITRPVAAPRAQ